MISLTITSSYLHSKNTKNINNSASGLPIHQAANDMLKINPIVCNEAWYHPHPYNNITHALYDENARERYQLTMLEKEMSSTSAFLDEEFSKIHIKQLISEEEAEKYIDKTNKYAYKNTEKIAELNYEMTEPKNMLISISADGKVLHDIDNNTETVYYTKETE